MNDDFLNFPHSVFALDDRPLCVWDADLGRNNLNFLSGANSEWFIDSITHHLEGVELERIHELDQSAALSVRIAYHHALETFFAVLFAAVQAPFCIPAWLDLYDVKDLCSIITRINNQDFVLNAWEQPRPSWEDLASIFNSSWREKEGGSDTIAATARAWNLLAHELCDEPNRAEYNCVKHGFRARSGGFVLRAVVESTLGTPAPPEAMNTVGSSRHGWSAFALSPIPSQVKKRKATHFHMKRRSGNWLIESTFGKLQILTISIENVIGTVKIRNGIPGDTIQFHRFADATDYQKPWLRSPGVTTMEMSRDPPDEAVALFTPDQLRKRMEQSSGRNPDKQST